MDFQTRALGAEQFRDLFGADEETLSGLGVKRIIAGESPGFPCRVSLIDAFAGESVLLLNYEHPAAATPYRSRQAIFVREWAAEAQPDENEIPEQLRQRLLSARAFDDAGMMIDDDLVDGQQLGSLIEQMFANESVSYLHLHNAKPGCYAALVERR
ncbi:MAG: DUF1203 domain-containing protein [Woeseiaceae bacterium]